MRAPMTVMGVGPRIFVVLLPCIALAAGLHAWFPEISRIPGAPHLAFRVAGAVLVLIGVALWAAGSRVIIRAFRDGRLLTTGAYAVVRHPMYSGSLVFIATGVALILGSWLLLTVPVVAAVVFKVLIRREEEYLAQKHGQAYRDYRARVPALVPGIGALRGLHERRAAAERALSCAPGRSAASTKVM